MKTRPTLVRYQPDFRNDWDAFVAHSRNGTFLLQRGFMDYHADRFADHSLLCYYNNKLVALLPAEEKDGIFTSHRGLTYGGFIVSEQATATVVLELMEALIDYLRSLGNIKKLVYSPIPSFYATYPSEEDRYALFRHKARLTQCKISSIIPLAKRLPFSTLRKRKVKAFEQSGMQIVEDEQFAAFWTVLTQNLQERHHTQPTHSLSEIELLHQRFPENIHLHRIVSPTEGTLGGAVVFETETTAHVQYISSTERGRQVGALDGLFQHLVSQRYAHKSYFDFGISVEQGGHFLNEGLIHQKEGFGARGTVYETYEIDLSTES